MDVWASPNIYKYGEEVVDGLVVGLYDMMEAAHKVARDEEPKPSRLHSWSTSRLSSSSRLLATGSAISRRSWKKHVSTLPSLRHASARRNHVLLAARDQT